MEEMYVICAYFCTSANVLVIIGFEADAIKSAAYICLISLPPILPLELTLQNIRVFL